MARIEPLDRSDLTEHEDGLALVEAMMGFVPNSMPTMARVPGLLPAFQGLGAAVLMNDLVSPGLKQMIAMMTSAGAGCRYCQAHTSSNAARFGVPEHKLAAIWQFETSEHFSAAERAALRLAFHAGQVPNAATDADFAAAREHFSDEQIAACVEDAVTGGGQVVALRKSGSATIAPAHSTVELLDHTRGAKTDTVPVSVMLQGEYGIRDVVLGVPAHLGPGGLVLVEELPLSTKEQAMLETAAKAIRARLQA